MSLNYNLTLFTGTVKVTQTNGNRNNVYTGSDPVSSWSPIDPDGDGWSTGDSLTVHCGFNLNPMCNPDGTINQEYGGTTNPPASEYVGLFIGACKPSDGSTLLNKMKSLAINDENRRGAIINLSEFNPTITKDSYNDPSEVPDTVLFYNATSSAHTFYIKEPNVVNDNVLINYIYQWNMDFNANNKLGDNGEALTKLEIVFGYGDPHVGEVGIPVKPGNY